MNELQLISLWRDVWQSRVVYAILFVVFNLLFSCRSCEVELTQCEWVCQDLKDGEKGLPERVEVAARLVARRLEVEPAAKQLHAEQSEDDDE